jgi:hypothetical protein
MDLRIKRREKRKIKEKGDIYEKSVLFKHNFVYFIGMVRDILFLELHRKQRTHPRRPARRQHDLRRERIQRRELLYDAQRAFCVLRANHGRYGLGYNQAPPPQTD